MTTQTSNPHQQSAAKQAVSSVKSGASSVWKSIPKKSEDLTINKTLAIIIWLGGAWLTKLTIEQMGVSPGISIFIAIPLQLALTRAESPIWRGRGYPKMAIGALIFDSVIANTPGAFRYTQNIGKTDFWYMVQRITQANSSNFQIVDATVGTQFAMALGIGTILAASAEYFWNLD